MKDPTHTQLLLLRLNLEINKLITEAIENKNYQLVSAYKIILDAFSSTPKESITEDMMDFMMNVFLKIKSDTSKNEVKQLSIDLRKNNWILKGD